MTKHTPTPWAERYYQGHKTIYSGKLKEIATLKRFLAGDDYEHEANAAIIVKAVNCHDELVEALEPFARIKADDGDDFNSYHDDCIIKSEISVRELKLARAAIFKAKGE